MRRYVFKSPLLAGQGLGHRLAIAAAIFNDVVADSRLRGVSIRDAVLTAAVVTTVAQERDRKARAKGADAMKTAREIACGVFQCGMRPRSECSDDCDLVTAAIDQAGRDGAEWMRKHIAREAEKRQLGNFAVDIRAMPVTP